MLVLDVLLVLILLRLWAYADDIALMAPIPSAMRKLLSICDAYAAEYNISFHGGKSKFLVVVTCKRLSFASDMCECSFRMGEGGRGTIENVKSYPHLGHIITSSVSDADDIRNRRNRFVARTNGLLCLYW